MKIEIGTRVARILPNGILGMTGIYHGVVTGIETVDHGGFHDKVATVSFRTDVWRTGKYYTFDGKSATGMKDFIVTLSSLEWLFDPDTYYIEVQES